MNDPTRDPPSTTFRDVQPPPRCPTCGEGPSNVSVPTTNGPASYTCPSGHTWTSERTVRG